MAEWTRHDEKEGNKSNEAATVYASRQWPSAALFLVFFFSLDRGFFLPTFQSAIVIISLIIYSHATRLSSRWYFPPSVTRREGYTVSIHGTLTRWLVDLFGKIYKRKMMENTGKKGTRLSYKNSISILSFKRCSSKWWKQSFGNWQVSLPRWFQKAIVWDRQW